jgi:hypothetical protein
VLETYVSCRLDISFLIPFLFNVKRGTNSTLLPSIGTSDFKYESVKAMLEDIQIKFSFVQKSWFKFQSNMVSKP